VHQLAEGSEKAAAALSPPRPVLAVPRPLRHQLEARLAHLVHTDGSANGDFLHPHGEPALIPPDSVSWKVFKNPLALYIGGITAVVMQLAEPRVGSGVWQYTSFRQRPLDRLRRTGHAAMMTVYGPRSRAESMIAGVTRMHARVRGIAPDGRAFCASDPELLDWVHATACFGFLAAYDAYVRPLAGFERDRYYAESRPAAELYGARSAPGSQQALEELLDRMGGQLRSSDIVFDFLRIMRRIPALPAPLRPLQGVLIQAAIQVIPARLRDRIGLSEGWNLAPWRRSLLCRAGDAADRLILRTHPAVQACRRLDLPDDYLYAGG
jgi:uncharacterized protein (DUF2236 family)